MNRKQLPPLSTLPAFEAAGRLMSFTAAAHELNVSQAAVSKQIRHLEAHIGARLFTRKHRAIELTAEGREYLHTTVTALTHLRDATLELKAPEPSAKLVVAVDESIGALWLMKRMERLISAMPDTTFHVVVSDAEQRLLAAESDVAILHGSGAWPRHESQQLFEEDVFPVCAPAVARTIVHPNDLVRQRLIDLEDDNWSWINWRIWLTSQGISLPATHRALTLGSYPLVLEAARRSLGVALAWRHLVEDDLASGRLVRPLTASVVTGYSYYLAWPRDRPTTQRARDFIAWVNAEQNAGAPFARRP